MKHYTPEQIRNTEEILFNAEQTARLALVDAAYQIEQLSQRLEAAGWHSLVTDPPTGKEAVLLYHPGLHKDLDFPGHCVEVSNVEYAKVNAVKFGYTHWCPIPDVAALAAGEET